MKQIRVIYYIRLLESEYRVFAVRDEKWKDLPSRYLIHQPRRFPAITKMEEVGARYSSMVRKVSSRLSFAEGVVHDIRRDYP